MTLDAGLHAKVFPGDNAGASLKQPRRRRCAAGRASLPR